MAMNFMAPWLGLGLPGSGDVWQKVTNVTDWFSPKLTVNYAGDPRIEEDVTSNVASYGKQLGILTEAVLALSGPVEGIKNPALKAAAERLTKISAEIEAIKKRRAPETEDAIVQAMTRLKTSDAPGYERVLKRLEG
ncbi:MAG: hypothetical protein JWM33_274 [Caulobacteraceae bacterium]|nr:hypothetical protein [Caulobacteraceae bacterium]